VRRVPGGAFNRTRSGHEERDILRLEGPFGTFPAGGIGQADRFLASGTGLRPSASSKRLQERHLATDVALLGRRRPKDLYLNALAERWARGASGFELCSGGLDALAGGWLIGRTGFVHRAGHAGSPGSLGYQVYACRRARHGGFRARDFPVPLRASERVYSDSFTTRRPRGQLTRDRPDHSAGSPR